MRFIKSPLYFNYLIEDTVITNKSSIKDLGVLILSAWNLHVSYILGKLHRSLGLLHRTFSHFNFIKCKEKLYITLVTINNNVCTSYLVPHLNKEFILLEKI